MNFSITMQLISAFSWIIVYILIIKKGLKDKICGMPFLALSLNLSWEFMFTFIYKTDLLHQLVSGIWFFLDSMIFLIFLKYGYSDFKKIYSIKNNTFYKITILSMCLSLIFMYLAPNDFKLLYNGDILQSAGLIAYFQNLIMSILFIIMIIQRQNLKGQSLSIAFFKWIGTLSVGLLKFFGIMPSFPTEIFIILLIQFFDMLYIYILAKYNIKIKSYK